MTVLGSAVTRPRRTSHSGARCWSRMRRTYSAREAGGAIMAPNSTKSDNSLVGRASLGVVLADHLDERAIADRVEDGVLGQARVDVLVPEAIGHDEHVVAPPLEALAVDLGIAASAEYAEERAGCVPERLRALAAAQELRTVGKRRERMRVRQRIYELHTASAIRIAGIVAHRRQRVQNVDAAILKIRRSVDAAAALE